jgi:cell shape-determining protein MreC
MIAKVTEAENKAKTAEGELAHYKGQARAKGLEGQVLAVNGAYNFVVLSLGDRQGVVMNSQMVVFRGDRMVARVKVTSVEPSTSIADIIPGSSPSDFRVMPGDRVVYSGA